MEDEPGVRWGGHDDVARATYRDVNSGTDDVFCLSLCHGTEIPNYIKVRWDAFCDGPGQTPEWSFWREWYQGFLDGAPVDWELQRRVALIPDEEWEKGPERVAELIAEIRARYDLEQRIGELEQALLRSEVTRHGIGGNLPPEPVDAPAEQVTTIVWAAIDILKEETQKPSPSAERIRQAIEWLTKARNLTIAGIAGAVGTFVVSFSNAAGKAAGKEVFVQLNAEHPELIQGVIDTAEKWLPFLN